MTAILQQIGGNRLVLYGLASLAALALDMAVFLTLMTAGFAAGGASAIGYCLGIVVHWLISSRAVFVGGVADRGIARTRQKALFVLSAFAGLAVTTAIVAVADGAGFDPRLAKLAAIVVSFAATWLLRSCLVFRAQA